jgi:hypothetical protein
MRYDQSPEPNNKFQVTEQQEKESKKNILGRE